MVKVIINADDLGMSEAFNYGVIKSMKEGLVSSTSIMVNLPTAEHARDLIKKELPEAFVGLHTNFVLGKPCEKPENIPNLVDAAGNFLGSKEYKTGERHFVYEEVKKETIAQMERFKQLFGAYPEHIEGHSAMDENVGQAFYEIALEYGVHASMFGGAQVPDLAGYLRTTFDGTPDYMKILDRGVHVEDFTTDRFGLLSGSAEAVIELHFHPGYVDQFILDHSTLTIPRCRDLDTLCRPELKNWFEEKGIERISFGDLRTAPPK